MKLDKSIVVSKKFTVRPDGDSDESKTCTLELTIPAGTSFQDLAFGVLAPEVIKVQASARKGYEKYPNGHTFKKTFARPGIETDPMTELLAQATAQGVDIGDKVALTEFIMSKLNK